MYTLLYFLTTLFLCNILQELYAYMNSNCIIFYYINWDYIITVVLHINVDIVYTLTLLKSKMNYCAICILLLCGLTRMVERKTYGNRSESLISTALVMSPDFEYKYFPASTNTTAGWKSNNFDKIAHLNQKHPTCFAILIFMQAGDLNPNPGPYQPKFSYAICKKAARWDQGATGCDHCNSWYHIDCMRMSTVAYNAFQNRQVSWICCQCGIPNFASSLFSNCTIELTNNCSVLSDISTSDCSVPRSSHVFSIQTKG